jgi:hypothetical protein
MTKLIAAFRNFAKAPRICKGNWHTLSPIYAFSNYRRGNVPEILFYVTFPKVL